MTIAKTELELDKDIEKLVKKYNIRGFLVYSGIGLNMQFANDMIMRECCHNLNVLVDTRRNMDMQRALNKTTKSTLSLSKINYMG